MLQSAWIGSAVEQRGEFWGDCRLFVGLCALCGGGELDEEGCGRFHANDTAMCLAQHRYRAHTALSMRSSVQPPCKYRFSAAQLCVKLPNLIESSF